MVARSFNSQDLPYTGLLQNSTDDREFLTLEELKPHQLTELSGGVGGGLTRDVGLSNDILELGPSPSESVSHLIDRELLLTKSAVEKV